MPQIKHIIVLSSPSGGGKSTLARYLINQYKGLEFSISATTRPIREGEVEGEDYYFLDRNQFDNKIQNHELVEYEEIFGNLYGTLKSELERTVNLKKTMLFDVDVKGAISLKKHFPNDSLLIFIYPPNKIELEKRLRNRRTESEEQLSQRLNRYDDEITYKDKFDYQIENDNLEITKDKIIKIVENYIDPELKAK